MKTLRWIAAASLLTALVALVGIAARTEARYPRPGCGGEIEGTFGADWSCTGSHSNCTEITVCG